MKCKRCNSAWDAIVLQLVIMGQVSMMAIIAVMIVGEIGGQLSLGVDD